MIVSLTSGRHYNESFFLKHLAAETISWKSQLAEEENYRMGQKHGVDTRGKGAEFCGCWEILTEFINGSSASFDDLPDDCLAIISSFTSTPRDAFLAALVSKSFGLQFNSDSVWEKFLPPPDYVSLLPKSRVFSSKKELYFALCDPFPNHNGKMVYFIYPYTVIGIYVWILLENYGNRDLNKLI